MLFHISEESGIARFEPRASEYTQEAVVWGIDAEHLRNYLVPRECPRVTYYAGPQTSPADVERFLGGELRLVPSLWPLRDAVAASTELYPYGSHLQTWVVSFGFAWVAFGMLFAVLALVGARESSRIIWIALLAGWFICWLPPGIIGVGFAWAGQNAPSVRAYQDWASRPAGFALLLFNALILLAHFGLSLTGFVLTGMGLRRVRRRNKQCEQASEERNAAR